MGVQISIIFPTRGRHTILSRVIESLERGLSPTMSIEFCIKVDSDDTDSIKTLQQLNKPNIKILITPRGRGYLDLPIFFNQLFQISEGEFIWCWSDDAYFEDPGDLLDFIEKTPSSPLKHKQPLVISNSPTSNFPILHSDLFEVWTSLFGSRGMGALRYVFCTDGYIQELCRRIPELCWAKYSTFQYSHLAEIQNDRVKELLQMPGILESIHEVEQVKLYLREHTGFAPEVDISRDRLYIDQDRLRSLYREL